MSTEALLLLGESLRATAADLDGYIQRRAQELAQPRIKDAEQHAEVLIDGANHNARRLGDVNAELRRRIDALERQLDRAAYEDLLGSIWLYVGWHRVTRQLTTEQKELFADAVDASSARRHDGIGEPSKALRWWRDG